MPEPFFIHEDEIIIWTQNQNLYCKFRVMEDAHVACACLLMKAQEMMGQNGLSWKYIIISERKPLLYDDEAAVPFYMAIQFLYWIINSLYMVS